jgi:hypothetical protein
MSMLAKADGRTLEADMSGRWAHTGSGRLLALLMAVLAVFLVCSALL